MNSALFFAISLLLVTASRLCADYSAGFFYTDLGSSIRIDGIDSAAVMRTPEGTLVTIPGLINAKPVTEIGEAAFSGGSIGPNPNRFILPDSITHIRERAFFSNWSLLRINLPKNLKIVGDEAISKLRRCQIDIPKEFPPLESIGWRAFRDTNLERVVLTNKLKYIGDAAFEHCDELRSVSLYSEMEYLPNEIFWGCTSLKQITLPKSLRIIGNGALGATGISSIKLPKHLKVIGGFAFYGCYFLKTIRIPEGAKLIGGQAFEECLNLREVNLPSSLTEIQYGAFSNCKRLLMIRLPASLKKIETEAFYECSSLEVAIFNGKPPKLGSRVFQYTSSSFKIIVGQKSKGFTVPKWKGIRVTEPSDEIAVTDAEGDVVGADGKVVRFGSIKAGSPGKVLKLQIWNLGNKPLSNVGLRFSSADRDKFIVQKPVKTTIAPGKMIEVRIRYRSRESGYHRSDLSIFSSDSNESPTSLRLLGSTTRVLK